MVKTLTIRDEVYQKVIAINGPEEGFGEPFERLVEEEDELGLLGRLRSSLEFEGAERKRKIAREITEKR